MLRAYEFEPEARFEGFAEDGKAALEASPDYFLWWYSAKSILLVAAVAGLAFYVGKSTTNRRRRSRR